MKAKDLKPGMFIIMKPLSFFEENWFVTKDQFGDEIYFESLDDCAMYNTDRPWEYRNHIEAKDTNILREIIDRTGEDNYSGVHAKDVGIWYTRVIEELTDNTFDIISRDEVVENYSYLIV